MKNIVLLITIAAITLALGGCPEKDQATEESGSPTGPVSQGVLADHPEMTEQEMYIPCSSCHKDETPEIYAQWWDSGHGIGNVKCYQCHGTYENMVVVPSNNDCEVCHADWMGDDHTEGRTCWQCHKAHEFTETTLEGGQK